MFAHSKTVAALTLAFGLVGSVAQAQNGGFAAPAGYQLPGGFTQPAGYNYPTPMPYPVPAPVVVMEPPVRLGFQWAMCDYGMNISAIREGGLAHQVGLLPGDIIVQMNTFQIAGWNEYCLALQDAVYNRGGQVEMWLYRATPAGYELQYVCFTIHEQQIIVTVPCCYHVEKCHGHHVSCWNDRLVYLNQCWKKHHHHGGNGHHHGLSVNFLGKGINLNFGKGGVNFGHDNHGHKNFDKNFGGQFGNFKFNDKKPQIHNFNKENFNFEKNIKSQFKSNNFKPQLKSNHGSNFSNQMKSFSRSNGGGNSMKNFSSQMSRGSKSSGGSGRK
jgi:hypothetical protein